MRLKHKIIILSLVSLFADAGLFSQTTITDSLIKIALRVPNDSASKLYVKIANVFTGVNSDSVRKYARIAGKMASPKSIAKGDVLIQMGNSYHMESKMDSALFYFNKGLLYYIKIKNDKGVGKAYQSFSIVKKSMGDYIGSMDDSKKALESYRKINWNLGIVNVLNNISATYAACNQPTLALQYSREAFGLSATLNDSLKYYMMMAEYGGRHAYNKSFDSGTYFIKKATPYLEKNQMFNTLIPAYSNLSLALYGSSNGDIKLAKEAIRKALYYSYLSGATDNLKNLYRDYSFLLLKEKNTDSARMYFERALNIQDSVVAQRGLETSKELQTKYETEKKEFQLKQANSELNLEEEKNKQKTIILWLGAAAFTGTLFFLIIAFINYKKAKKANIIINNQNQILELQKQEVENQKHIIEEKQHEIISSINYAQRIQSAVLTGQEVWNKISKEHFIVFQPRDIVSGDFYWAHVLLNGRAVFALADCTGHGVPGGFMSMLGNSFLNELVVENKLFKADEILNRLRDKVIAALFQQGQTEQKDGMDMALCVWNKMDNTLEFAGANNALYLVRDKQLIEYKGDKMPIGTYLEENKKFTAQKISLATGDMIYLSTDGFADQFGGEKGKKFKYKQLEELLVDVSGLPLQEQKNKLQSAFIDWKLNHEQTDDVSVIGIRVC